jgi:methylmalonyl-CoA/ethylmalonyl-CoA epimerase
MQIAIRVRNLERAIVTYRDKLGFRYLFQAPSALAFFDCGGIRLMLSPSIRSRRLTALLQGLGH